MPKGPHGEKRPADAIGNANFPRSYLDGREMNTASVNENFRLQRIFPEGFDQLLDGQSGLLKLLRRAVSARA